MEYDELKATREIAHPEYLLILEDNRLYGAHSIVVNAVEKNIFAKDDGQSSARRRLSVMFSVKLGKPDGQALGPKGMANAWYGARIKLLLPDSALSEARRKETVEKLNRILIEKQAAQDLTTRLEQVEARLKTIAGRRMVNPLLPIRSMARYVGARPKLRLWGGLSVAAVALTVSIWAWQRGPWFEPDPVKANRLAILACPQTDAVFYSALAYSLNSSRHIRARNMAMEELAPAEPCSAIPEERLARLAESFRTPFITWGLSERDGSGYRYKGWLYQKDKSLRAFQVTATDRLDLADAAASQVLAMLGFENDMILARPLYSTNPAANLLFSEGELFAQRGRYHSAVDNLDRASRFYDPDFLYGQSQLARALIVEGEFLEAKEVLDGLLARDEEPLNPQVQLSVLRSVAHLRYLDFDFSNLGPLLVQAKDLALRENPGEYLFFIKLEAKMHLSQGNMKMADSLIGHYLNYARERFDPAAEIFAKLIQAEASVKEKEYGPAFQTLEEALVLAQDVGSMAEEVDVIIDMAKLALKTKANYDLALARITDAYPRLVGTSAADAIELNYREGQIHLAQGAFKEGAALLRKAYQEAADHGLFSLEYHARIRLAEQYLRREDLFEVDYIMEPLEERVEQAPPEYRIRYGQVLWRAHYQRGQYSQALTHLNRILAMAHVTRSEKEIANLLNNVGWVHFKNGDLTNAEKHYLDSFALKEKLSLDNKLNTIHNLVLLYDALNDSAKKKHWQSLLDNAN